MQSRASWEEEEPLQALLDRQAGVARVVQLAPWLSRGQVSREIGARRWQRPARGVVVTHNGPLSPHQQLWVAMLSAHPSAVLGGLTAAGLDGFAGFPAAQIELVVPPGVARPSRAGVRFRFSTQLSSADVHPLRRPARTRLARSIVDAASWASTERMARAVVLASVQQRLVRPDQLSDALGRRGPSRRHELISESIEDARGGVHSLPEHDFEVIRRRYGLPEPSRQAVVQRSDGRWYLDVDWDAYCFSLEIHGIQHSEILTWDSDLDRLDELTVLGRSVLQVTSYAVRRRQPHVGSLLQRALRSRGWSG